MLNRIWAGMIVVSVLCAVLLGRMGELSQAILEGSQRAVTLTISMTGMAALRAQYGSTAPFEITPAVWVVSAVSLVTALTVCRLLEGRRHHG